jgi:CelD/BcsL family acetyltransferase involved in cellulose biosynthesis
MVAVAIAGDSDGMVPGLAAQSIRDVAALAPEWRALAREGIGSPFQHPDWVGAFHEEVSAPAGARLAVVAWREPDGALAGVLPLEVTARAGLRLARVVGGRHASFALPLMSRAAWRACTPGACLADIRALAPQLGIDGLELLNAPVSWAGRPNPLVPLPAPAPTDAAHELGLEPDADVLIARVTSADNRKKLRKKAQALAALGEVAHLRARTAEDAQAILAAFLAQKSRRFAEKGIADPFDDPCVQAFVRRASLPGVADGAAIELHALTCGDRIVATYGFATSPDRLSGMFNSFDDAPDIARCSPGDLLLRRIVSEACARGVRALDLGVGSSRYKASLCDTQIPVVEMIAPFGMRARGVALAASAAARLKQELKRHPGLHAAALRLRRALGA